MEQKKSIVHTIDHETIKVLINAHHQISLPGQDLTLKIVQMFFENSCELRHTVVCQRPRKQKNMQGTQVCYLLVL